MRKCEKYLKLFCMMALAMLCIVMGSAKTQAADVTLKNGKWAKGVFRAQSQETYYKINIKKTGYIKIDYVREDKSGFADFEFCNAKKAVIKETLTAPVYFAVKKGIYYVRIAGIADMEEYDWEDTENIVENYSIRYTFTAMKNKKNPTNIKKAPLLKKNKQVSGLVFSGKKAKNIIYKLTLTKETKVKFKYEVMSSDVVGLWLRIADQKGNWLCFNSKGKIFKNDDRVEWWEGKGSDFVILPKGTFYFVIQVFPGDSGYYKLKLNW